MTQVLTPETCAQANGHQLWRHTNLIDGRTGWRVAAIGDINKDSFDDVIAGAPHAMVGNLKQAGRAYVLSGMDGRVLRTINGTEQRANLGWSVSDVGDVDGDKYPDVIVGIPHGNAGHAKVFSGRDWTVLHAFSGVSSGDQFGYSVACAGDVDRDSIPDFVVGAPVNSSTAKGYAVVFSGANGSVLHVVHGQNTSFGNFGESVSGAGDLDADGYADFMVADASYDIPLRNVGRIDVFSGKTGAVLLTIRGSIYDEGLGGDGALAGAGDVNGDKIPDVIAGARFANQQIGLARVFSGKTGATLRTFHGTNKNDYFGTSVAGGADLNQDLVPDLIVGVPQGAGGPPTGPGYVDVYSGKDWSLIGRFTGAKVGDVFGFDVATGGRIDADQIDDVVIGAWGVPPGGQVVAYSILARASIALASIPRIGTTVATKISSPGDPGRAYIAGFSAGTLPGILLPDRRIIPLNADSLLAYSLNPGNLHFRNSIGFLNGKGTAKVTVNIPNLPVLIGLTIHTAFIVIDPSAPLGIRRISKPLPIKFE